MKFEQNIHNKIVTVETAQKYSAQWKSAHKSVVFTNGCFDIIHKGHVLYLAKARDLGSKLIVGLNSDASVRRLKGTQRPIKEEESRALTLAAFACVDLVVVFEQDTPLELIKSILPTILVKGKDYEIHEIVGADFVLENGGIVQTIDLEDGFSSSNYINRI